MTEPAYGQRRRRGGRVPAVWRRGIFVAVLAGLVGGNVWLLRKQFPGEETQRHEAYDRGLRALDTDRDFLLAEREFRRYLALGDEPRVRVLLAIALQAQGKVAEAKREFTEVVEKAPEIVDARLGLADIARAEEDYEEAFRQLEAAERGARGAADAFLLHGEILASAGDLDGAIAIYRRAIEQDPNSHEAHLAIADLLTIRSHFTGREDERQSAAGSYREAENLVKQRLSRADDRRLQLALARAIAGQVVILQERELAEAVRQLDAVAKQDPADPEPTLLLGRFLVSAKKDDEARRTFEDAAAKWPVPATAIALHEFLANQGEHERATQVLVDAVQRHREDAVLRIQLIGWYAITGRMADAERELSNATTIFPDDWRVREAAGDLARERARRAAQDGRPDDAARERVAALAEYRRALEQRPRAPRLKKKAAEQVIDTLLTRTGDGPPSAEEAAARQWIEDVLRVNRSDAQALEWQARMLLAEGRAREVAESLRGQLDAPLPSIQALRILGIAAVRSGDDATAAAALVRVVDLLAPRTADDRREARRAPPDDWCNAIRASLRTGRLDLASGLAREALEGWPESPAVLAAAASTALARDDVTRALALLAEGRTRFPQEAPIRILLARALERAGRMDEAGAELESAATDLGSHEAQLAYFDFLARTGRLDQAEKGILAMIASEPSSAAGHLRLGDFYLALNPPRREAAVRSYEAARDLDASDPQVWLRLADLHLQTARTDAKAFADAEAAADRFEALAPEDPSADYLRGKLAILHGRHDEAVERLRRFAASEPDRAAGHYYLATALRAAGRPEDALEPLEKAVRLNPGEKAVRVELATLHYDLGVRAFNRGDFDAARRLFQRADQGGVEQGVRFLLAGSAMNSGSVDVGEAECRKLVEAEPESVAARHMLASVLLRKGTREAADEAEGLFRRTLETEPADLFAQLGVGTALFAKQQPRDALEVFRRAYPASRSNPTVALAICTCHMALSELQEAVDFLDAEAAAHPDAWDFPHMKGDFLVQLGQPDEAVKAYLEAARRAPELSGPPLAAAATLMGARKLEEARALLVERQAGSREPAMFAVALGDVLDRMDRRAEAQDQLRRALTLAPGHPRALFLLGRIAEASGKPAEARKLYREAVDRGTADPECHARLATLLAADRDFAASREAWLAAHKLAPRQPLILNNLALVTGEDEARLDEAIGYARTAAALAPELGEIADTYGWLLFRAGRFPQAAQETARAAALLEDVAVVQFHAGMALARTGRAPEARSRLEKALLLDPKFEGSETARTELERLR